MRKTRGYRINDIKNGDFLKKTCWLLVFPLNSDYLYCQFTKYMKALLLSFLLLAFGFTLSAQSAADSLLIVHKKWNKQKISKGILWKQAHFDKLYASNQEVNILEVKRSNKRLQVTISGVAEGFIRTSDLAQKENAIAAINGSFFDTKKGGSVTFFRKNGSVVNETTVHDKGKRHEWANGALTIGENHDVHIIAAEKDNKKWEEELDARDVLVCGPVLLTNDSVINLANNAFNLHRHPRSAIAITKDNKLLLVTVDGRNKSAQGMNLKELAYLLKLLGAEKALNLDGGGSTTLFVNSERKRGILNHPTDNKRFDHEGERPVANAILIKKSKNNP